MTTTPRRRVQVAPPVARILDLASRQLGLVTRHQLRALDITPETARILVARGLLVPRHPGVYAVASHRPDFRQDQLAACLWAGAGALACRRSAAVLWGLGQVRAGKAEVVVPHGRSRSPRRGISVHESRHLLRSDAARIGPIPVTAVPLTLIDLAATDLPTFRLGEALDDALRRGLTTPEALRRRFSLLARSGRTGVARFRPLLEVRTGTGLHRASDLEQKAAALIREAGLPPAVREHPVKIDDDTTVFLDFAWPERKLAVECDSSSHHFGELKLTWDDDRQNELVLDEWLIIRITWVAVTVERSTTLRQLQRAWAARPIIEAA